MSEGKLVSAFRLGLGEGHSAVGNAKLSEEITLGNWAENLRPAECCHAGQRCEIDMSGKVVIAGGLLSSTCLTLLLLPAFYLRWGKKRRGADDAR